MEGGNRKQFEIIDGGGSSGQGGAAAVHGGIQAEGFARGGSVQAARGDRSATEAGGFVLVESDEMAQAARARGAGRVVSKAARAATPGEKPASGEGSGIGAGQCAA